MFSPTRDIKSLGIIALYLMVPLFMASVLVYYVVSFIGGLGIISTLAPQGMTWGSEYIQYIQFLVGQFDKIILLIYAVLVGRLSIQSFRTDIHPIYGLVGLFSIPALIFLTGFTSNIIGTFTGIGILSEAANQFTLSFTFFQNLPSIVGWTAVFIIMIMIGTGLLKRRQGGGGL